MARNGDTRRGGDTGTHIITKTRPKTKRPSLYKVLLLNDDYTPMDFVVYILERFFNKAPEEATRIMLHVHQKGVGICGVYTYEVAETKVAQVTSFARQHEHPLLSLLDDRDAAAVMRACDVDLDLLRDKLTGYLDNELAGLVLDSHNDAQPTAGFQRVIHRAVAHVQSSGREEVTGANVLVAIFAERESHAAFFLQEQHMTRFDAVNYISHGIAKR